jgi:Tfp pilus assembly protein PilP
MTLDTRLIRAALLGVVVAMAAPAAAQQPAKKGAAPAPAPAPPPAKKVDLPVPPPNFEYAAQGRRDPFVSLVARGNDGRSNNGEATKKRAEGVPGIMTSELTVRGVMQSRGTWVAMVAGADKKVYTVRPGDKLADGVIRQITANSIVILQEVNDPLSLEKQREVRKFLRGGDEVK